MEACRPGVNWHWIAVSSSQRIHDVSIWTVLTSPIIQSSKAIWYYLQYSCLFLVLVFHTMFFHTLLFSFIFFALVSLTFGLRIERRIAVKQFHVMTTESHVISQSPWHSNNSRTFFSVFHVTSCLIFHAAYLGLSGDLGINPETIWLCPAIVNLYVPTPTRTLYTRQNHY